MISLCCMLVGLLIVNNLWILNWWIIFMNHLYLLTEILLLHFPKKVLNILFLLLLKSTSYLKVFLTPWKLWTDRDIRGLFTRYKIFLLFFLKVSLLNFNVFLNFILHSMHNSHPHPFPHLSSSPHTIHYSQWVRAPRGSQ